jgi:hypothetical protein
MDIKISSFLKAAAEKTALVMIEKNLTELDIPDMSSFRLSKAQDVPAGYQKIKEIEVKEITFNILQKI